MKKIDQATVEAISNHVTANRGCSYKQVAVIFEVSHISVKRFCADLGRGKGWRRDQKGASSDPQKFWVSVDRDNGGCWLWKGSKNSSGYGFLYHDGASQAAHRVAYTLVKGQIPEGLELDHRCRNRLCCNPDHLEPVTRAENMKRVRESREPEKHEARSSETPGASDWGGANLTGFFEGQDEVVDGAPKKAPEIAEMRYPHYVPTFSGADPLSNNADVEERRRRNAEDFRWGLTEERLLANNKLLVFKIGNSQDGLSVRVAARSGEFAKETFESIWGPHYDVTVREVGTHTIAAKVAFAYSWKCRAQLDQERRDWESSDAGAQCRARRCEESQERIRRENFEGELEWTYEQQDRLWLAEQRKVAERRAAERKKAAARRRKLAKTRDRYSYDNGYDDGDGDRYDRGYDDGDGDAYDHGDDE
jgi:hypothetical protein